MHQIKGWTNLGFEDADKPDNMSATTFVNGSNTVYPEPGHPIESYTDSASSSSDPEEKGDFKSNPIVNNRKIPEIRISRKASGKVDEIITYAWKGIHASVGPVKRSGEDGDDAEKGCCGRKKSSVESKEILKNVTGVARPFELLAIMGASGAGKTTLLNVLTFRNTKGLNISGDRTVNGQHLSREILSAVSAYVQQDDVFIGTMTVREHMIFQARVRMHPHIPMPERLKRVDEVLMELGLKKCENTLIGIPGRIKGISGGEMKRLSFASEVLTDPPLMFCDEPTSGLDSYMAQNVVEVLKELADKGKTIICTIHQPSSQVYAMFDRILLMAEGRTAYLGNAKDALGFFQSAGYTCPSNFNPSDFFIQQLAIQPSNPEVCRQTVGKICDGYDASQAAMNVARIVEETKSSDSDLSKIHLAGRSPYKASWGSQFAAVTWRSWITMLKDPMLFKIRLAVTCFTAVLFGIIYLRQDLDQEGIMNLNGALFLFLTNMTFQNTFAVVNVFCAELPVFLREHFNGMYRTDVYFLAKTLTELPVFVIVPFVFTTITYWMIGFNSDWDRYLICCGIVILIANTASSFGYMVSCIAPNLNAALSIGPVLIIPFMLFGGFFLNSASVPVYFIWLKYLSWFLYGNEALALNQWKGVKGIECNRQGYPANNTCIADGHTVLKNLNFNENNMAFDISMLVVLLVGFRVVAFLGLLRRTYASK